MSSETEKELLRYYNKQATSSRTKQTLKLSDFSRVFFIWIKSEEREKSHIIWAMTVVYMDLSDSGTKQDDFAVRRPRHLHQLNTFDIFTPDTISPHGPHYDSSWGHRVVEKERYLEAILDPFSATARGVGTNILYN